jgi:tetratricopeptide (TPR) repeat protein
VPHTEWLTYDFVDIESNAATARLRWGERAYPFRISTDVTAIVMKYIRQELQDQEGFKRLTWEQAATFALNNGGDLNEALEWIDAAIEGQFFSEKTFANLSLKAQILTKQGKSKEADAIMEEAMSLGSVLELHGYGRQLIAQGNAMRAMEVFKENARIHKDTWPVDYGMARAYSALGHYSKALKHLKIAQVRAPDTLNQNAILVNIKKLEKGEDIN